MTELNKIKGLIELLSSLSGADNRFSPDNWSIDYELNLDEELKKELDSLQVELNLLQDSLKENDLVTAKCALTMVRMHSLNLSGFFMNIFEDIEKVGWSEKTKIPIIPDGYEIPKHYNYHKK